MSIRPKSFVFGVIGLSLLFLCGQAALNILVDPFKVFGSGVVPNYDVNPRYTKLKAVTQDPGRYDAVILGSCLSSVLRPETADRLTGHRYFNLSTHNSDPAEASAFLGFLLERGVKPKQVVLNMEGFRNTAVWDVEERRKDLKETLRLDIRWPYFLSGGTRARFYFPYVMGWVAVKRSYSSLVYSFKGVTPPIVEHEDGYWEWENQLESIRRDPRAHAEEKVLYAGWYNGFHNKPCVNVPPPEATPATMECLRELSALSKANGIELICFLPPGWALRSFGTWRGEESAWTARQWVKLLGFFYDFGIYDAQTLNPFNYLNRENFTPHMGDLVLEAVFGNRDGIGYYLVTQDNVEDYILFKQRQQDIFNRDIASRLKETPFKEWITLDWTAMAENFSQRGVKPLALPQAATDIRKGLFF